MKKSLFLLFLLNILILFSNNLIAQNDSPCSCANRWQQGGAWNIDGTIDDLPAQAHFPKGIVRCGNAADTQSDFNNCSSPYPCTGGCDCQSFCTYNPNSFAIDLSSVPCFNPNNPNDVPNLQLPQQGCDIMWVQLDVRPYAGTWQFQIVGGADEYAWALYASTVHDKPTVEGTLGGDCSTLALQECGSEFSNTWSTITTPDFDQPSNYYLAIWDINCHAGIEVNLKFRNGCGEADCFIALEETGTTTTCASEGGGYDVCFTLEGANGLFNIIDNTSQATNIRVDGVAATQASFGLYPNGPFQHLVCLTYPASIAYDVNVNGVSLSVSNDPCTKNLHLSNAAPSCCSLQVNCSNLNSVSLTCGQALPAANNALISVLNYCGGYNISHNDVDNGGTGCGANVHSVTRTYTITDQANNSQTCSQLFTYESDNLAPLISSIPANQDLGCNPVAIPVANNSDVVASDACSSVSISSNDVTSGTDCNKTLTRTYTASDACGNSSTKAQTITYKVDTQAPVLVGIGANTVINCGTPIPNAAAVTATDNCSTNLVVSNTQTTQPNSNICSNSYFLVRTYNVTDACGNTSSGSQSLEVKNCCSTPTYCTSKSNCSGYEWIKNVSLSGINKASGASTYSNYSTVSTNLTKGQSYTIYLTPGYASYSYQEKWRVWIDWNNNGLFTDAGEQVLSLSGYTVSGSFTVPASAANCPVRMRVSMSYGCNYPTPCSLFSNGEVEDYTINPVNAACVPPPPPPSYCSSQGSSSCYGFIKTVKLNTINNTSTASGYTNFTNLSTNLAQNSLYTIYLTPGYSGYANTENWRVWIDYNKDGDFLDAGELVTSSTGANMQTKTFTVPSTASLGSTRMRIVMYYSSGSGGCGGTTVNSCGNYSYGETEDYSVNIGAPGSGKTDDIAEPDALLIEDVNLQLSINNLYPNPTKNNLNVEFTGSIDTNGDITIYDVLGRTVQHQKFEIRKGSNQAQIQLNEFANGVYVVEIKENEQIVKSSFTVSQ